MNRIQFLKSLVAQITLGFLLAFNTLVLLPTSSGTSTIIYLAVAALLFVALVGMTFRSVHKRLKDVTNIDPILANGLFWISYLLTSGLVFILLIVLPTGSLNRKVVA